MVHQLVSIGGGAAAATAAGPGAAAAVPVSVAIAVSFIGSAQHPDHTLNCSHSRLRFK